MSTKDLNRRAEEVLAMLQKFRGNPYHFMFICGNESGHESLFPTIEGDKILLKCNNCDFIREYDLGEFIED
jgi:hypothetical protein